MFEPTRISPSPARSRSARAACRPLPRSTSVKQPDCETYTLISAAGDSRFIDVHHGLPFCGSCTASVPIRLLQRGICGCAADPAKLADATKALLPIASKPVQSFAPETWLFMRNPPSWPAEKTSLTGGKEPSLPCLAARWPVFRNVTQFTKSLRLYTPAVTGCQSGLWPRGQRARAVDRNLKGARKPSGHPAVHANHVALDITVNVGTQERHRAPLFRMRAGARGGHHRRHLLRRKQGFGQTSFDDSGRDHVDGDVARGHFARQRFRRAMQCRFGRG